MIPLEKQVTSLELSKQLKELGVKQDSIYYWLDINDEIIGDTDCMLFEYDELVSTDAKNCFSAFTVAELGEMLPTFYTSWHTAANSACGDELNKHGSKIFTAKAEADARAKMLIYLEENKLMEANK